MNIKKVIIFVLICLVLVLALSNNILIKSVIAFILLLILWITILLKFIYTKLPLLKDVRKRKYFFVTEKGYKTDLKKRCEIGNDIYWITNILCILVMIFTTIFSQDNWSSFFKYLLLGALGFAFFGIVLAARNYLTGLSYYLVPWIVLLLAIDCISSYNNIKVIFMFILWTLLSYSILTVLLPLHSLHKVNNMTWIFGVLTTLLISVVFEYGLQYYIPNELISNFYEMSAINSELSLIRFLMLTSYSIGNIVINLKIKLGEAKAKDIYDKISISTMVQYPELRDCIFYGGEKYEDKILSNPDFKSIIVREESNFEKYKETSKWRIIATKVIGYLMLIMKKMI